MKRKESTIKSKPESEAPMSLKEIESLIKFVQSSGVAKVSLTQKDFKITIKTTHGGGGIVVNSAPAAPVHYPAPVHTPPASMSAPAPAAAEAPKADDSKYVTIKSPMIGTFYRSSSPDKPVLVNVGDVIKAGQPICIIEAMKLFNEIESELSGKVIKVLVDNASPVEYDQPLFLVEPK